MKQVLFVCSGNYYRSRFAEHLFNRLASQANLPWRAESRGLAVDYWADIGPISPFAVEALEHLGIEVPEPHRNPKPVTRADLARSDLVVAVKESEHRALLAERCPSWEGRVEYWSVDDLDCAAPEEALPVLEANVRALVLKLISEQSEAAEDTGRVLTTKEPKGWFALRAHRRRERGSSWTGILPFSWPLKTSTPARQSGNGRGT